MGKKKEQKLKIAFGHTPHSDLFDQKALLSGIIEIREPYQESERIFDVRSGRDLDDILKHIRSCPTEFVTGDHPDFVPPIPEGLVDISFLPPGQTTAPRIRVYYDDPEGVLRTLGVEVRQENKNGRVHQTVKIGHGGTAEDSTLERIEQKSVLHGWGFNPLAIGLDKTRESVLRELKSPPLPVLTLTSQRLRIEYHPYGNPDVRIEVALESIHYGQTFTGGLWNRRKLEIEIKNGPEDVSARHNILDEEQNRLMRLFPDVLTPVYDSSATPGFRMLEKEMCTETISRLRNEPLWFTQRPKEPQRPDRNPQP